MRKWAVAIAAAAWAGAAQAEVELEPGRPLRLVGEVAAPPEGAPRRFVIDALIAEGEEPFQSRIEGWFASLDPTDAGSGEIEGTCVQERCALSVRLGAGEFGITGDLAAGGAARGQAALKPHWSDEPAPAPSAVTFAAFDVEAPGLGRLAPRGAIGSHELSDQLAWAGIDLGFSNLDDEEPDGRERSGLADWQAAQGRPPSGLLLLADLAALKSQAEAARRAAGWTKVEGAPWAAGYPAAVLRPVAGQPGRFASADGRAELVWTLDAPMDEAGWDALVERETADTDEDENRSYTRVNDDLEMTVTRAGVRRVSVWLNRPGGLAHMAYRYPEGDEALARFEPVLLRTFRLPDDFGAED
ncbi:hypothetical protein ACFODL_14355 [Phenylobacterium terrae]|uniref:Uncharacterized protein n=1 Tax=Phenylobacterium terrae TaxID=2665495 RepID=A0ABW4N0G4_9CAUL